MSDVVLHYAPKTRSRTILWLLEELSIDYQLTVVNLSQGEHRSETYLEMNPLGKVPVVVRTGVAMAEIGAIAINLGDLYPQAGLAPPYDSDQRAAYLQWIFFSSAIMEPAYAQKFFGWEPPGESVAWGSYDRMRAALDRGLAGGPYILGDQFSVADVVVGSTVRFGVAFGALPDEEPYTSYLARLAERPAFKRASEVEEREVSKLGE